MDESKIIETFDEAKQEVWTDDDQYTVGYNNGLEAGKNIAIDLLKEQEDLGTELTNAMELVHKKNERIKKLEEQIETLTKWRMNAGAFD